MKFKCLELDDLSFFTIYLCKTYLQNANSSDWEHDIQY
jgi:hypothetical protein